MRMNTKTVLAAALLMSCGAHAEPIANWQVLSGSTSSTSGLTTDSPTFGNGSANDFQSVGIGSLLGANGVPQTVSLDKTGDTLTASLDVTLIGGSGTGGQFRFGLYNDNGNFGTTNSGYAGGWNYVVNTDLYAARTDANFLSTAGNAMDLNASKSTTGSFDPDSPTNPYTWTMTVVRSSQTTVDIETSFVGGDGSFNQTYTETGVTTSVFSYNVLGSLSGGSSGLDQMVISGAQYNTSTTAVSLFSDDFEGYAPGGNIDTSGPWGTAGSTAGLWVARDESTATPFGTPNQYGEFEDDSSSASIRLQSPNIAEAVGNLTTFSFDFVEPTGGGGGDMRIGYSVNSADLNGAGARQLLTLNDGVIGGLASVGDNTYNEDTAYTMYMIYNDTGADVDYDGGTITNGQAHIWIEELDSGNFVFVGTSNEDNAGLAETHYRVGFRSYSTNLQTVLVDNVELVTGAAAVPEPSSLALLGLGALLITRRRRG